MWPYFHTGLSPSVLPDLAVVEVPKTQLWNIFSFTVTLNRFPCVRILSFPSIILISLFMLIHFPSNVLLSGNLSLRSWSGYLFACKKRTGQVGRRRVSGIPVPVGWECERCREDIPALYGYGSSLPRVLGREGCGVTLTHSPWAPQSLGFPSHNTLPWAPRWLDTSWCLLALTWHVPSLIQFSFSSSYQRASFILS